MTKGSMGYSGKSGSPELGVYGLEKGLGGIKEYGMQGLNGYGRQGIRGYGPQGKESGMVYMIIGVNYTGNPNEIAQGLQQYLPLLGQYLSKVSEGYGKMPLKYDDKVLQKHDVMSLKGFFKPYNKDMGICEICRSPTPEGIRRCPSCISIGEY